MCFSVFCQYTVSAVFDLFLFYLLSIFHFLLLGGMQEKQVVKKYNMWWNGYFSDFVHHLLRNKIKY